MNVEDVTEIGEDIHIWIRDRLVFEGKYQKDNSYAKKGELYWI